MNGALHFFAYTALSVGLASSPSPAQGDYDQRFQFDGTEEFGLASIVAFAGDVNGDGIDDFLIGAPHTSPNGIPFSGTATVYSGATGAIIYEYHGPKPGDGLGSAVSGAGDVDGDGVADFIIGAPDKDPGGVQAAGSVWVYSGANGTVIHRINGTSGGQLLGGSVAAAGDVDGDGFDDIILGAPSERYADLYPAGAAYVYSGATGALLHRFESSEWYSSFGTSVAGVGDTDGDGYDDVLVGAPSYPVNGSSRGDAFLYSGATGQLIRSLNSQSLGSHFGADVSSAGDVDADGIGDIVIGASFTAIGSNQYAGSVFVYSGATGAQLHRLDGTGSGKLGSSVSGAGDVNGDGHADIIAGEQYADPNGLTDSGSAYIYSGADGTILHQFDGQSNSDEMGSNVAGGGNLNGDPYPDLLIGAVGASPNGLQAAGSVYAHTFNPFMTSSSNEVSASAGGTIHFDLSFPETAALDEYKILISASGTGPTHYGVDIPLTVDNIVIQTYFGNYPIASHSGMHGSLDSSAMATASADIPAGAYSSYVGLTLHMAAIANQPGSLPQHSSVAVPLLITP